jgi:predicted O-linked N-acetylglucosamine transferase (SPINDLY family)
MSHNPAQEALNLAIGHHHAGRHAEAEGIYRQLCAAHPDNTDLIHLLGVLLADTGRWVEGKALMEKAVLLNPSVPHYHTNLGTQLIEAHQYDAAIERFGYALRLKPDCPVTYYNLGRALMATHRWNEAVEAYQQARRFRPDFPQGELDLGVALHCAGRRPEAITHYQERLRRFPEDVAVMNNLGNFLKESGELDKAVEAYQQAGKLFPDNMVFQNNLGLAYKSQGQLGKAIEVLSANADRHPRWASIRSNLILTMLYDAGSDKAAIERQQHLWNRHHSDAIRSRRRLHTNPRSLDRRLKIGYVSVDLRDHVAGRALLPTLARHDHQNFEIVCYCLNPHDTLTPAYMACADLWRDVGHLSEEQLADAIRADGVDILVDLSLHTSENRLLTFAYKPAPIQISWIGYPGSSGTDAIDYRLTDQFLEPPEGEPCTSAEKPFLLPHCWQGYEAPAGYPDVNALPASANGYVTFGSFNNFCKITPEVLGCWASIMMAVPGSHLRLLNDPGTHRARTLELMSQNGIAPERIHFFDYESPSPNIRQGELLKRYHQVDIALDSFPYNGMTTTMDALWMGVPVISVSGPKSIGRAGLSILSNLGHAEFSTQSVEAYVRKAIETAMNIPRLVEVRRDLRSRMVASPICDAEKLTRDVEAAYRKMWQKWCAMPSAES